MRKEIEPAEDDFIEITRGRRSFAFLNLQFAVANIANLINSAGLYNEFAHVHDKNAFLSFAHEKYKKGEFLEFKDEEITEYVLRLDLGRNIDFLHELAFLHLINRFLTYCSDIMAVAALGSPDRFDLNIRVQTSRLASSRTYDHVEREMGAAIISRLGFMTFPELKKLLLSKIKLSAGALQKFDVIAQHKKKK